MRPALLRAFFGEVYDVKVNRLGTQTPRTDGQLNGGPATPVPPSLPLRILSASLFIQCPA